MNDTEQAEKELEARMRKAFSTEDPGLFTACMDDPDNKRRYPDEERRARVCASIHKKITGIYPAEHESKSLKQRLIAAVESIFGGVQDEQGSAFDAGAVGAIFKQSDGRWRWVSFSSNAYEDGDREIISQKALEDDVRHSDATKEYGPLLWWHMSNAELGSTDFRAMHGKMLVESGLFHLADVGQKMAKSASKLKISLGFYHPLSEPDGDGVFQSVRTFERSPLPATKAANQLTALPVITKESTSMDEKKLEALKDLLGDDLAAQVVQKADEQEKSAKDAGVRFKDKTVKQDEPPAKEPAAEEAPGELPDDAPVTVGMLKEVITALRAEMQQMHEEMTAPMAEEAKARKEKSEALESRLTATETEIKRLTGGLPRAVKTGFRASAAPETVVSEEKTKEINPPPDPLAEFTKLMFNQRG